MSRTVLRGRVVLPDRVVDDGMIVIEDGRISHAGERRAGRTSSVELPAGAYLLPGLVDAHCHGGGGGEFGPDPVSARRAAEHHHRAGSTTVVASLVSAPRDSLLAGMRACASLAAEGLVAGVHTEGPFLAPKRCGAQDPDALSPVDLALVRELAVAGAGHWLTMTMAPELPGAEELMAALHHHGVRVSVGHTDATAGVTAQALTAAAAGGRLPLVTHLFNGMPPFHHRDPGPAGAALAAAAGGAAYVELIGDGIHLADETVAMALAVSRPGRAMLVTDAMAACGMPDGDYRLGRLEVVVAEGAVRLREGGALAGGVATLLDVVRRCTRAGVPLVQAVAAASVTPAQALGLEGVAGTLAEGRPADVLAVDQALRPVAVWRRGRQLRGAD
jgi:N-acetylglucosamine-6-phosphate deacetylase